MSARCPWADEDPLYIPYHDEPWGVPLHDDRGLFEMLILEGRQAGLSWLTILRKREGYRRAFDDFDPELVASYTEKRRARLLADPGMVRNRQKIDAAIGDARGFEFTGSTICCAYMQALGMVNDHLVSGPRHAELA